MFVPPQRVWILRRFGQHSEKGIKFLFVWVWNRVWFSRDWLRDCTCYFNSKWIRNDKIPVNKRERVVCEFEIDFNKSFCWSSNLSNNDQFLPIPGLKIAMEIEARSENGSEK